MSETKFHIRTEPEDNIKLYIIKEAEYLILRNAYLFHSFSEFRQFVAKSVLNIPFQIRFARVHEHACVRN
jgi:hypothetical protein